MPPLIFFAPMVILWMAGIAFSLLALWLSRGSGRLRFWMAIVLSVLAVGFAYVGMTHFHFESTRTVNGEVQWHVDSKWFFIASLVMGVAALAYGIWRKMRVSHSE